MSMSLPLLLQGTLALSATQSSAACEEDEHSEGETWLLYRVRGAPASGLWSGLIGGGKGLRCTLCFPLCRVQNSSVQQLPHRPFVHWAAAQPPQRLHSRRPGFFLCSSALCSTPFFLFFLCNSCKAERQLPMLLMQAPRPRVLPRSRISSRASVQFRSSRCLSP